ncbi:MHS family MFS transporter [Paraburkholderia sp. Ac-20336]|uniref:MFS transporter n=1 Tax=Paraburkholderia sp. Ac-20336 TaxID=2703886 RepID=UPI00197D5094|nr:MFS transporter [Paraburkholderia sp. Ac-20336]MBN3802803.1 MHS family MFS transporter [Paraburkholderia sp. Ac-20336]
MQHAHAQQVSRKNIRRAVFASTLGTIIEWYDYGLYAAASGLIINKLFFPQLSQLAGVLAAFATFAVGFVIRPVGGIVISHIGDKYGRKPALVFCVTIMGAATVGLGLLPTYQQVGMLAPALLVLLRLMQGFGAGAELAGAITLIAEYTPPSRRAFFTSIPNAATNFGVLIAITTFLVISSVPESILYSWAWRVPFLISLVLFGVAIYIRSKLDETPEYIAAMEKASERARKEKVPVAELFRNSRREVLCGFLAMGGHQALSYVLNTFALSYMTNTLGMAKSDSLIALIIALAFSLLCAPVGGMLADRYGSGNVFAAGALIALSLVWPLFHMIDSKDVVLATIAMSAVYGISWGCTCGAQGSFLSNLFPTRYRFSGIAMCRELSGAIIGGPTPFIATALVAYANGKPTGVMLFLAVFCLLTLIAALWGKRLSRHQDEQQVLRESGSTA